MRATSLPAISPGRRIGSLHVSAMVAGVAAVTVVGLALRVFWALYTQTYPLGGDAHWYFIVGINVAKGFGYVAPHRGYYEVVGPGRATAFWPPGYPLALAANFKLFGVSVTHAKVMNALFGAATVPFVYALTARLFDKRAGLLASAIFAVFPNAIAWTPVLLSEEMFTFLFVASLWFLAAYTSQAEKRLPVVCFGLLTGLAALTRGEGLVLLPIAVTFWLASFGPKRALRYVALATVVAAATIAPWTLRNAITMHTFIPISTNTASNLRIGHAPGATGDQVWTGDVIDGVPIELSRYEPEWELAGYRTYPGRAVDYAAGHPGRELELSGLKLYHLYQADINVIGWSTTLYSTPFRPAGLQHPLLNLVTVSHYALFFAALLSVPLWLRRDPTRVLLAGVFVYWSLFHVAFHSEPRYHVPLFPLFAIAAAAGVTIAWDGARAWVSRWRAGLPYARLLPSPLPRGEGTDG